mmetsp:Transcript_32857/g.32202  ORF Transcript_32857/g.32202 Transcript_32857/m.32202 type:complete len:150 (-) Transcript_32857:45-494(-)
MKEMGLIGDFDFACTERAHKLDKLDKQTDMSLFSEESYLPINEGPAPMKDKPRNVPALDFNLMNQNLAKERKKMKEAELKKKLGGSDPGKLNLSEGNSSVLIDMIDQVNHNKYGKEMEYMKEQEYKQMMEKQPPEESDCRLNSEGESSP